MISSDWLSQIFEKKLVARVWVKWAKVEPETRFFAIFSGLVHSFFVFETAYSDSLQEFLTSSGTKIYKKKIWEQNLGQRDQNRTQN